ncbi:hypothetical protein BDZ97DRAFT_1844858 [Flammula alnicola]|nr:hypothetical protein BDZ97DRAFT_1844858 [Flammula alnicola]
MLHYFNDLEESEEKVAMDLFPFASHLASGDILSEDERSKVRSFVSDSSAELEATEAHILNLENEVEMAIRKYQGIALRLDAGKSLLAPVRDLPDDILREIFQQSLPTDHNALLKINSPPLSLTRTCRRWREVALTTPRIWRSIHIPVIREFEDDGSVSDNDDPQADAYALQRIQQKSAAVQEWLKRAGVVPLDISISRDRDSFVHHSDWKQYFDIYIGIISQFTSQWRAIFISAPYDCLESLAKLTALDLPSLESLALSFGGDGSRWPVGPEANFNECWSKSQIFQAENLRKLSLTQSRADVTKFNINWARLTHLSIQTTLGSYEPPIRADKAATILRTCSLLVQCRLEVGGQDEPDFSTVPIVLPRLRTLSIVELRNTSPLMEILEVPAIQVLEFHSTVFGADDVLLRFLSRITRNIRSLIIDSGIFSPSSFVACLRSCPRLKSLSIKYRRSYPGHHDAYFAEKGFEMDNKILRLFTGDRDSAEGDVGHETETEIPLCPELEEFICRTNVRYSDQTFLEFVTRKQNGKIPGIAKLRNVIAPVRTHEWQFIGNDGFKTFKEDGMTYELLYVPRLWRKGFEASGGLEDAIFI